MKSEAFILRYRVKEGKVLLFNRHIRELSHFEMSPPLIAWVHERLEWAAANLLGKDTDAVLVLSVDPKAEVKVSLEETRPLPHYDKDDLLIDDDTIRGLCTGEGVWPSTVWLAQADGSLVASTKELFAAADTLTEQLATTQGITVSSAPQTLIDYEQAPAAFAVSDEFGYVPLKGSAQAADTLKSNLDKLFGSTE